MCPKRLDEGGLATYFDESPISVDALGAICSRKTDLGAYPTARSVDQNILIYEGDDFRRASGKVSAEAALRTELCGALKDGPGMFVVKGAYPDLSVIDRSTAVLRQIVDEEREIGLGRGDHFGENERIWNSFQKACAKDPDLFIDYYGNPVLSIACEAWLGPFYQVTAQMNNVKPGSAAQSMHRDFHLGFQSTDTVARFPAHAQRMSQYLTLQGAVAHTDMPAESGPTQVLPYSHLYSAGYQAYGRQDFQTYFSEHRSQLPLEKGDMVLLSPAVFHAAGANTSRKDRIANLLQISSAFGRTMETIDHTTMVEAVYSALLKRAERGALTEREVRDVVAVVADGYAFPTNLDSDPPLGGNAPETGQDLMRRAVEERWPAARLQAEMSGYAFRRKA